MKVLYLINYAGSGGSERYVELLARYYHGSKAECGLCYNEDGTTYVWAENRGKLEKRTVELGDYNMMADMQEICWYWCLLG